MDTIDTIPQIQIRRSEDGEEEDLYFVPSDEDEEEEEENKEKKEKTKTITETTEQMGRRGEANDDEDLYFVPSNEEEENGGEARENEQIDNLIRDKKKENITAESELTRKKASKERNYMEQGTRETKKKMKVTRDNFPFGHVCNDIAVDNDTQYVRVYCQNVSGIFDREGIGLDSAFKEIKQAGADIFTFNETHGDKSNTTARRVLRLSKQRMWTNNNEECKLVHSSSNAPVINFTKPGGNLVGITGSLVGRFVNVSSYLSSLDCSLLSY
jgi:hypothetical protein